MAVVVGGGDLCVLLRERTGGGPDRLLLPVGFSPPLHHLLRGYDMGGGVPRPLDPPGHGGRDPRAWDPPPTAAAAAVRTPPHPAAAIGGVPKIAAAAAALLWRGGAHQTGAARHRG